MWVLEVGRWCVVGHLVSSAPKSCILVWQSIVEFYTGGEMEFSVAWLRIRTGLAPGIKIKNWTAAKGYLGDEFSIVRVESNHIEVNSPNAETIQRVGKGDFEVMFVNWEAYCAGTLARQALVKQTRVSKYTMSILKHLDLQL
jgi:hypothetical protein